MSGSVQGLTSPFRNRMWTITGMTLLFFCCVGGYLFTQQWTFLIPPFLVLAVFWGIRDFCLLYLMIWACIPFAIELDLPGGLATDFPAEPLMWVTCLLLPGYLFIKGKEIDFRFVFHPVWILLFIHFSWITITSITSQEPVLSLKFTLAKSWYLICFVLVPLLLFRKLEDFRRWGFFLFIPLVASVFIILVRHSQYGFTFSTINNAVIPIYRNHVDYACSLGILLPFAWWMRNQVQGFWLRSFFAVAMILMVTGIYFSFTRAAWLCIPLAFLAWFIIRLRLMRVVIPVALAFGILLVSWLSYDNRYISYSPDYEKAITHKQFDDLVSATYKMEDISTVERFYRWVAGYYMVRDKPWIGFGPSTFYSVYHAFVDRHFITYVSDNPEHSGIHNYYLMVAVEQGLPGLAIFLILCAMVLLSGEKLYHRMRAGPGRQLLATALVSFCCSLFILTLNDTVETDKLGTFFFLCMAIVIQLHLRESQMKHDTR